MKTKKEKLLIAGMGHWNEESFIRIKADKKSKAIPKLVDSFLNELKFKSDFEQIGICKKNNYMEREASYKDNLENHSFFENKTYNIHVIFGEKFLYFIIKTSLKNRKKLIEKLMLYAKWIKSK